MSTFTPPTRDEVEALEASTSGPARRFCRHMAPRPRGINVYYLSNGTVTETDPDSETVYWSAAEGSPYVAQAWWGSTASPYTVTAAQAAALEAADYEVDA